MSYFLNYKLQNMTNKIKQNKIQNYWETPSPNFITYYLKYLSFLNIYLFHFHKNNILRKYSTFEEP